MNELDIMDLYKILFTEYPEIVSVAQIQKMLGISRHASYNLIREGVISSVKIGTTYHVLKINIIKYMTESPSGTFKAITKATINSQNKKSRKGQ